MKPTRVDLAIIGSGASAIYLLRHLAANSGFFSDHVASVSIFEKSRLTGCGMPYSPETTDRYNMSNISSEELPALPQTLVEWLHGQDDETLAHLDIRRESIDPGEVYIRLALGAYLSAQYQILIGELRDVGIEVREFPRTRIRDIQDDPEKGFATLVTSEGERHPFGKVVIATGHVWDGEDHPERGYYASPWPIFKILPEEGTFLDHKVGTLGASLSAFDVVSSLAHRHGAFSRRDGKLVYLPAEGTEKFSIVLHASNGWLPHLQFDQDEPFREIYRHTDRESLLALRDDRGFLRIDTYFDEVCRPALSEAFRKDGMDGLVAMLATPDFGLGEFVAKMESLHQYSDAFAGMHREMAEARDSVLNHRPIHWKEVIDDLMYTLNFHAELMPAEDQIRFRSEVMPFLMNVIAAMPLSSARILLALNDAGKLDLVPGRVEIEDTPSADGITRLRVDDGGIITQVEYRMFIECGGQRAMGLEDYPFPALVKKGAVRKARAPFADPANPPEGKEDNIFTENGTLLYETGGVDIDASYRIIGKGGQPNSRIHDIAFPHTSGVRPYSYGLQACDATCEILIRTWMDSIRTAAPIKGDLLEVTDVYEEIG